MVFKIDFLIFLLRLILIDVIDITFSNVDTCDINYFADEMLYLLVNHT